MVVAMVPAVPLRAGEPPVSAPLVVPVMVGAMVPASMAVAAVVVPGVFSVSHCVLRLCFDISNDISIVRYI
jgi:hypothetical protein